MKVKVAQSCPTLCDPKYYTVHGILQARILKWVAFPFSRGSSQSGDRTHVSHNAGRFFTSWATREARLYIHLTIPTSYTFITQMWRRLKPQPWLVSEAYSKRVQNHEIRILDITLDNHALASPALISIHHWVMCLNDSSRSSSPC